MFDRPGDSRGMPDPVDERVTWQIKILWKRMRVIRTAIALASVSALRAPKHITACNRLPQVFSYVNLQSFV